MKKKASIGCLFWIAVILLVLVVFAFNKSRIEQVMEVTGFMDVVTRDEPETTIVEEPAGNTLEEPEAVTDEPESPVQIDVTEREPEDRTESTPLQTETEVAATQTEEADTPQKERREEPQPNIRRGRLYFVHIEGEAGLLKGVMRPIYYYDSPLTDTLKSLLRGPSTDELNMGLISLIPGDTAIRGITVKNGVARVDLSESFRFNTFGKEGYKLQLMQIVYTATEFPTVNAVQFLINGNIHTYLGPEGVYIGGPLNRDSF